MVLIPVNKSINGHCVRCDTMFSTKAEESDNSHVAGLGFFPQAASSAGASHVDDMMHRYMQQCLEYHEQQLQSTDRSVPHFVKSIKEEDDESIPERKDVVKTDETTKQSNPFPTEKELQPVDSAPHYSFKSIKVEEEEHESISERKAIAISEETTIRNNLSSLPTDDLAKIEAARDRAQAILSRFQQQQQQCFSEQIESRTAGSSVFAAVRQISLAKEAERKKHFLEKNLNYVTAREAQRMQQQADELSAAEAWNREYLAILNERQRQRYETQKQRKEYIASQAGIGTTLRKHRVDQDFQKGGATRSSIAVYVSGFADSLVDENVLRDLFRTYGNIEKVHIYRDKIQGSVKGDGLVIFEGCRDPDQFLDTVCQQVSKAML